jgi:Pyruvate/2-oxoacid:ferredoxin oxidoreductase delta subunit
MREKVLIRSLGELPPVPCTVDGMDWNPTGLWRYLAPVMREKAAPCTGACPAGNPLPRMMAALAAGEPGLALAALMEANPLPGVTGRLCYHPCQRDCLRREVDRALPIQALERFAADRAPEPRPAPPPPAGAARVAVLGAGPAGLTCAYLLGRAGLAVAVHDPAQAAGGFLAGAKGLPPRALAREVRRLAACAGLELRPGGLEGEPWNGAALVVADETSHAPGSPEALAVARAAERAQEAGARLVRPQTEPGFAGFKPAQAAHAVGLGQRLAAEAREALGLAAPPAAPEPLAREAVHTGRFAPEKPAKKQPAAPLRPQRARSEAARCLSCGRCNLCQDCALFCPDACMGLDAAGAAPAVDLEHCKGCGICAHQCPRGVITMEAEL